MNRLVRGSVLLAVAAWACGGDPTANNAAQPDQLIANPSVVFVNNTDSQAVLIDLFNSLGQQLGTDFTLGTVGPGLTVTRDTTFRHLSGQPPVNTEAQFIVRGTTTATFVSSSFTITAGGKTVTVPVKITPGTLPVTFNLTNSNLGDTITIVAPANTRFTPATTVLFGTAAAFVVSISADSTTLSFIAPPGVNGAATLSGLVIAYLPGQLFTAPSEALVTTPPAPPFSIAFSTATPNIGDTVVATLGAGYKFLPNGNVKFAANAVVASVAADSSSAKIIPLPGSTGHPTASNVIISGIPIPLVLADTIVTLTVGPTIGTTQPGTATPATAPTITGPPVGGTAGVVDRATLAGVDITGDGGVGTAQFYQLVIPADGTYNMSINWDGTADIDVMLCDDTVCTNVDFTGATAAHPEVPSYDLTAGTYYIEVEHFAGTAPTWVSVVITQ